jgi:hypothetical protein
MQSNCRDCGGERIETRIPYALDCLKDGKLWRVEVPDLFVIKCLGCGELYFTNQSDDEITLALEELTNDLY